MLDGMGHPEVGMHASTDVAQARTFAPGAVSAAIAVAIAIAHTIAPVTLTVLSRHRSFSLVYTGCLRISTRHRAVC